MGRLCATGPDGDIDLFLMEGEVLAARSDDDDHMFLRRLLAEGICDRSELGALRQQANGGRVEDALFSRLSPDQAQAIAFDRLRENLGRFLMGAEPSFQPLDALFVGHLHIGHDSRKLLRETEALVSQVSELASPAGLQLTLARTGFEPEEHQLPIWQLLSEPRTVAWVAQKAPSEELEALGHIARMLEDGVLKRLQDLTPEEEEAALMAELEQAAQGKPPAEPDRDEHPDDEVLEEELAMFADNDQVRGAGGDGAFTKTREELQADRIDLTHGREDLSDIPELVTDEVSTSGVRMNFGGPRLSNDDAAKKVQVANEILEALCGAFDDQDGAGAGMARVQLLLDGAPSNFAVLFRNARAGSRGSVPAQVLIANLRKRPNTEHRRLLNRGLANLIDRAMNMGAENLEDDDAIDTFLETCVGYQGRLGL